MVSLFFPYLLNNAIFVISAKFIAGIKHHLENAESNPVFSEDLKTMVYTAETEEELDLVVQMVHR